MRRDAVILFLSLLLAGAPAAAETTGGDPVQFLFIHHSCGGQLLAAPGERVGGGPDSGELCIYDSHPNGGDLRAKLTARGFQVNDASYGSIVGEDTDICHWHAKFRDGMDRILRTERQDALLPDGVTNDVVAFKSCFPNNAFKGLGDEPGDPDSCELTVANAKAAYRALLPLFAQQPDVVFVAFTAPPLADRKPVGMKQKIKSWFSGKPEHPALARDFNAWLTDTEHGWLADYGTGNVAVFDYYGVLVDSESGWSAFPTRGGQDSHPSAEGNTQAAAAFLEFIESRVSTAEGTIP